MIYRKTHINKTETQPRKLGFYLDLDFYAFL